MSLIKKTTCNFNLVKWPKLVLKTFCLLCLKNFHWNPGWGAGFLAALMSGYTPLPCCNCCLKDGDTFCYRTPGLHWCFVSQEIHCRHEKNPKPTHSSQISKKMNLSVMNSSCKRERRVFTSVKEGWQRLQFRLAWPDACESKQMKSRSRYSKKQCRNRPLKVN